MIPNRNNNEVNVYRRMYHSYDEQLAAIEKLGELYKKGYLTDEEY